MWYVERMDLRSDSYRKIPKKQTFLKRTIIFALIVSENFTVKKFSYLFITNIMFLPFRSWSNVKRRSFQGWRRCSARNERWCWMDYSPISPRNTSMRKMNCTTNKNSKLKTCKVRIINKNIWKISPKINNNNNMNKYENITQKLHIFYINCSFKETTKVLDAKQSISQLYFHILINPFEQF